MNLLTRTVRLSVLVLVGTVLFFETGCGDVFRPIANPVVQPAGDPQTSDYLSIISCNGTTSTNGPLRNCTSTKTSTTLNINVPGDSIVASGDAGVGPAFASFDVNRGFFYIPSVVTDTVRALAPNTLTTTGVTITTVTLPVGSLPLATFPGSSQMYVLNAGSGTVCPNLGVLNQSTLALVQTVCIGSSPSWAVETGNNLYVLDKALNQVNVFSTQQSRFVASIPVGTAPIWATTSFDGSFVYVLNQGSNNISVIDTNTFTVANTISTGGTSPIKGYFDRQLVRLYILNQGSSTVTVFDALGQSTLNLLGTATTGAQPVNFALTADGTRGFVANSGGNTITEFSTSSFTSKAITVGTDPSAIVTDVAVSRDGSKIYAATRTAGDLKNGVTVIRASDEVVVTNLSAPRQDPNCNPAVTTCPLQQPQEFVGGR